MEIVFMKLGMLQEFEYIPGIIQVVLASLVFVMFKKWSVLASSFGIISLMLVALLSMRQSWKM